MLHIRWWHAQAHDMVRILKLAGVPAEAETRALCGEIVDTCRACREWQRPSPKNALSLRLAESFNQHVQIDVLFVNNLIVLHIIDEALRFSAGGFLNGRETSSMLETIYLSWLIVHGPPKFLVADQEGALESDEARHFCDRHGIQRLPKPVGSKAAIVERHHEVIRNTIRRTTSLAKEEGLNIPDRFIVAEAFFAHNMLTNVGGYSPYFAPYGRQPNAVVDLDALSSLPLQDDDGGLPGVSRHVHRICEIATSQMVQATATAS